MEARNAAIVVTTVQGPTDCMGILADCARANGLRLIIVGDKKGPVEYPLPDTEFYPYNHQQKLSFKLARILPEGCYARKNLGYLIAMSHGCNPIYETDDDNHPTKSWKVREETIEAKALQPLTSEKWANVYALFSDETIWPRGFALEHVRKNVHRHFSLAAHATTVCAPVQQGLADGSPDVDAIWRLTIDREITFADRANVVLPEHVWCPFNAQNTWWWRDAFPLMYLPATCTFRMTDIYRAFVAQKCLWVIGRPLEFHFADVRQLRNKHDLMNDFEQELQGYRRNVELVELLESCKDVTAERSLSENMLTCYELLVKHHFLEQLEISLVMAWLEDCTSLCS